MGAGETLISQGALSTLQVPTVAAAGCPNSLANAGERARAQVIPMILCTLHTGIGLMLGQLQCGLVSAGHHD